MKCLESPWNKVKRTPSGLILVVLTVSSNGTPPIKPHPQKPKTSTPQNLTRVSPPKNLNHSNPLQKPNPPLYKRNVNSKAKTKSYKLSW